MDKMNFLLNEISNICKEKNYSLVISESCTGGGLAYAVTKNPQSSSILERGYITYSSTSKEDILHIPSYIIQTFGVVSRETVIEMSEKALKKSKAQFSIAITGIDQETIKKEGFNQSGIVWISCASIFKNTISKKFNIKGDRQIFCEKIFLLALKMAHNYIK